MTKINELNGVQKLFLAEKDGIISSDWRKSLTDDGKKELEQCELIWNSLEGAMCFLLSILEDIYHAIII